MVLGQQSSVMKSCLIVVDKPAVNIQSMQGLGEEIKSFGVIINRMIYYLGTRDFTLQGCHFEIIVIR